MLDQAADLIYPGLLAAGEEGVLAVVEQVLQLWMGPSTVATPIRLHSIQRLGLLASVKACSVPSAQCPPPRRSGKGAAADAVLEGIQHQGPRQIAEQIQPESGVLLQQLGQGGGQLLMPD